MFILCDLVLMHHTHARTHTHNLRHMSPRAAGRCQGRGCTLTAASTFSSSLVTSWLQSTRGTDEPWASCGSTTSGLPTRTSRSLPVVALSRAFRSCTLWTRNPDLQEAQQHQPMKPNHSTCAAGWAACDHATGT